MADVTENADRRRYTRLRLCTNFRAGDLLPSCGARGSKDLARLLRQEIEKRGGFISLETVHCLGKCHIGPTLKLLPGGPYLQGASPQDAARIAEGLLNEEYEELERQFPGETLGETLGATPGEKAAE